MLFENERRMMVNSWLLLLMLLALMPFYSTATIAADRQDLLEGAKKEGEIMYYNCIGQNQIAAINKGFTKKYPFINPKSFYAPSTKLEQRVLAEFSFGKLPADVIMSNPVFIEVYRDKGVLSNYVSPELTAYPKELKDTQGFWGPHYIQQNVIGYNTQLVKGNDIPKSYADLLNPKWKGKIGLGSMAVKWFIARLQIMGEEKGLDYFRKLSAQDIKMFSTNRLTVQMLAAGEISIAVNSTSDGFEEIKAKGAKVDWVGVNPIVTHVVSAFVAKDAPHPNAAKLYLDFLLSREGQEIMRSFLRVSARQDMSSDQTNPSSRPTYYVGKLESPARVNELNLIFKNIFMKK